MAKTMKRFVLLLALVCTVVCCVAFAACDNTGGDDSGDSKVTYTVTVTTEEDIELTSLKAQWKSGSTAASEKIALDADGRASVELDAGSYTVELDGVPTGYTYQKASVTAANPDAQITIVEEGGTEPQDHSVMVFINSDVALPADLTVQLYNGTTAVGEPQSVEDGGWIEVPGGDYTAHLVLPDYLAAEDQSISSSTTTITFDVSVVEVEYKITVDADEEVLEAVTVTLYDSVGAVEDATAIELVDGVATVEVIAGNYTAKLDNLPGGYEYDEVALTMSSREATITVTAVIYTVNVDVDAVNLADVELDGVTAQLFNADGDEVSAAVALVNGTADIKITADAGDFTVVLNGLDEAYGYDHTPLTATVREATVYIAEVAEEGAIASLGRFYVEAEATATAVKSTIQLTNSDSEEDRMVTLSWNTEYYDISFDTAASTTSPAAYSDEEGYVIYVIAAGESATFVLSYTPNGSYAEGDVFGYIVEVEDDVPPAEGEALNPYVITPLVGTYSSERTDYAYYKLPLGNGSSSYVAIYDMDHFLITFYDEELTGNTLPLVSRNTLFQPMARNNSAVTHSSWLKVESKDGTPIEFTIRAYVALGAGAFNPDNLTVGEEITHTFALGNSASYWYKFTPDTTDTYKIFIGGTKENFKGAVIYSDYDDVTDSKTTVATVTSTAAQSFELTADETYILELKAYAGYDITFTLDLASNAPAGEKTNPIEVTGVGEELNKYTIPADTYFKHTITADSLNEDDEFVVEFTANLSNASVTFYSDSDYSAQIGSISSGSSKVVITGLAVDSVVYFVIHAGWEMTFEFAINPVPEAVPVLTVGEPLSVTITGNYGWTGTFDLDAEPGEYVLTLTGSGSLYGTYDIRIGSRTIASPSSFNYTVESFEIKDGENTITFYNNNGPGNQVVNLTILLTKPGEEVPVDGLTVNGSFDVTITGSPATGRETVNIPLVNVPAGVYTLKLSQCISTDAASYISPDNKFAYEKTIAAGVTEIEIEIPADSEKLVLTAAGVYSPITVTFTLEGDEPGLTVGGSYDIVIPQSNGMYSGEVPLVGVEAGTYTLTITTDVAIDFFIYATPAGGAEITIGTSGLFGVDPWTEISVSITIPADCDKIELFANSAWTESAINATFSLA